MPVRWDHKNIALLVNSGPPASDSFRIPMICSSLNCFRFMLSSPWSFYRKTHSRSGPFYGGKVTFGERENYTRAGDK